MKITEIILWGWTKLPKRPALNHSNPPIEIIDLLLLPPGAPLTEQFISFPLGLLDHKVSFESLALHLLNFKLLFSLEDLRLSHGHIAVGTLPLFVWGQGLDVESAAGVGSFRNEGAEAGLVLYGSCLGEHLLVRAGRLLLAAGASDLAAGQPRLE